MSRSLSSRPARVALVAAVTLTSFSALWPATRAVAAPTCTIVGTAKADKLVGTSGKDVICGLGGNDTITGNGGDDTIDGGTGNDTINGGAGADTISGGDGTDALTGGTGNDSLSGGPGTDTVSYSDHSTAVTADLDGVRDDGSSGETDLITVTVENLTGGSAGDTLTGSDVANVISGGAGDDVVNGGGGNDKVTGGTGNDKITGGAGADNLDGNEGTNVCDKDSADTVLRCPPDSTAPMGRKFELSAGTVDTSAAAKTVTATIRMTDNFSGVASVTAKLVGPATYTDAAELKSGTAADGSYEAVITVPKDAPAGTYALHVGASDKAGNALAPKATGLSVKQVGAGDKTAPVLREWNADNTVIDASEEPIDVTVTARVTDENSGVASVTARLVGPATYSANATQTDGDAADGRYSAVVTVPAGAPEGEYKLVIEATDAKGNVTSKETDIVVTNGPIDGSSEPPAPEAGGADKTAPFVNSWKVLPDEIDTTLGDEVVAVEARVTDAASGVASVTFQLIGPGGTFQEVVTTRASGTAADGVYKAEITVPEGTAEGNYPLFIGATDAAGNTVAPKQTNVVVVNEEG